MTPSAAMRPGLRAAPALAFVLALAGLWAYLWWATPTVDAARHGRALDLVRELKQLDAARDADLLRVRLDLLRDYDPLVQPLPRMDAILAELAQLALDDGSGGLGAAVAAAHTAFAAKADMVDRFQRHDSLLKNSLRYAPTAYSDLQQHPETAALPPLQARLGALMGATLAFVGAPETANGLRVQAAAQDVRGLVRAQPSLAQRTAIDNLLAHVDVIVLRQSAEAVLLASLEQAGTGARLDAATAAFTRRFEEQVGRQSRSQASLLVLSGVAVAAVAAALAWLVWRGATELRRMRQLVERTRADLRESQSQLIHAEKMTLLGEVVAGIVHEINTPLGYLRSGLQSAGDNLGAVLPPARERGDGRELEALEETQDLVRDGLAGVDQIHATIVNLLNFSRIDRSKVVRCRVENSLETTLRLASHILKGKVLVRRYGQTREIQCDLPQLNQVFLNLVKNAAQSAPENGGQVTITTAMAAPDLVRVDIADNGPGILPEDRPRIFDPFFTTRGTGNGLGLSISQRIVREHRGWIEVRSQPGAGATFSVLLATAQLAAGKDAHAAA
jgi:two-component system NtrC family sensor kinase